MSAHALEALTNYDFPGNVRELRNLLERACILSSKAEIDWIDLPAVSISAEAAADRLGPPLRQLSDSYNLRQRLAGWEQTAIEEMLASTGGTKAEAARRLGLSKSDLTYKLAKYSYPKAAVREPEIE